MYFQQLPFFDKLHFLCFPGFIIITNYLNYHKKEKSVKTPIQQNVNTEMALLNVGC